MAPKKKPGSHLKQLNAAHPRYQRGDDSDAKDDSDFESDSSSESSDNDATSELLPEERAMLEPNKRQRMTKMAVAPAAVSTAVPTAASATAPA